MFDKITVLGAGNGGKAISSYLASKGYKITLYEHPSFKQNIEFLKISRVVRLTGEINTEGQVEATTQIDKAVENSELIMAVVPAFAQKLFFEAALPYMRVNQRIIFIPDNYAVLEFGNQLRNLGIEKKFTLLGSSTLPFACRSIGPDIVNVTGVKRKVLISTLPSIKNHDAILGLEDLFTQLQPARNVLEVELNNINMVFHCPTTLLNAGRIESGQPFRFYSDGITQSICKLIEAIDIERLSVLRVLGLDEVDAQGWLAMSYGIDSATLFDALTSSKTYSQFGLDSPKTITHRYISEDIPFAMVPFVSIANSLGLETPNADSLVQIASTLNGVDYRKEGRSLEKLGLSGLKRSALIDYVEKGIL